MIDRPSPLNRLIRFFLEQKLVVAILVLGLTAWGMLVAPFDWELGGLPRDPVAVDAIPDIGENQQIVFTEWPGRSPEDIDDQITYPLTVSLLGIPGVKTIRSFSMLGFSSVYVIFDEDIDFYWSRSRILEKLNSLPPGTLPEGVSPALGPDATALGQVFWYTLEGRDPEGDPTGGWDLHELRSIQDWTVRYALMAADGVSEVASVGGYVQEYQIDVDPNAMRAYDVTLDQVFNAVRGSNVDVGARTIEVNKSEYLVRGLGFIENLEDIETIAVASKKDTPTLIRDIAHVTKGPALRRGALDKSGAEAVGGVVVVRYGDNPMRVIQNVKQKIRDISPGLPTKTLADGTVSQVTIVPFYDRTGLINETLGTLNEALELEVLVTIIVVILMVLHLRSSMLISAMLPLAVLMTFIGMKLFSVDANIVALSGIAIAVGTIVDMGIVLCENILRRLKEADPNEPKLEVVYRASTEVGGAVLTAVLTTVVSFLPVFTMTAAEGKLFRPLAYTKTFALIASIVIALTILPAAAHLLFTKGARSNWLRRSVWVVGGAAGVVIMALGYLWAGLLIVALAAFWVLRPLIPDLVAGSLQFAANLAAVAVVLVILTQAWEPLGPEVGLVRNGVFVGGLILGLILLFYLFQLVYPTLLRWSLVAWPVALALPALLVVAGVVCWRGLEPLYGPIESTPAVEVLGGETIREQLIDVGLVERRAGNDLWTTAALGADEADMRRMLASAGVADIDATIDTWARSKRLHELKSQPWTSKSPGEGVASASLNDKIDWTIARTWSGFGREFMPALDEGSFLYMPSTMPHASIGESFDALQKQDMAMSAIPEVDRVVGKIGRAETPLDPAPISMVETIVEYKPEYMQDDSGRRLRFEVDPDTGEFIRDADGELIPDPDGRPFRQWRDHIKTPQHIWDEIEEVAKMPGSTSAPKLQPIETRIIMLQSGFRAAMGVKVFGPDLESIEQFVLQLEQVLQKVPSIQPATVFAERIVGKPYLEIDINRERIARYGITIRKVQDIIEVAIGGKRLTTTVEGRERYPVRVRYMRELRDEIETLGDILVPAPDGRQIPLRELATIEYVRGPQVIKSENTFLVGYVTFGKKPGYAEVDVVESARARVQAEIEDGSLEVPAGVSWEFAGAYENQVRANKTLIIVLPVSLAIIFLILYFQFRSTLTTLIVFSGVFLAWSSGFILIWLYNQPWFLDASMFTWLPPRPEATFTEWWRSFEAWLGIDLRTLLQIRDVNLSVAVWVGFLALFGIATDNGVILATLLRQVFARRQPATMREIRDATVEAGQQRARACLMTTATTVLALLPVLTSTGRGSDVMIPMAISVFGGMLGALLTLFLVPVLYCLVEQGRLVAKRLGPSIPGPSPAPERAGHTTTPGNKSTPGNSSTPNPDSGESS